MPSIRPATWFVAILVACSPARPPDAGLPDRAEGDAGPQLSGDQQRPIVYACRRSAEPEPSGYHFERDGLPIHPQIVSLSGDAVPRPGDILRLAPADMILGPPGHYRYFTDPAHPEALELEYDGGPRHLVALRVFRRKPLPRRAGEPDDLFDVSPGEPGTIDRPPAALRRLRGLALETWSDDIAAAVARLDGAQLLVAYHTASNVFERESLPTLPPVLPPDLRALDLDVGFGSLLGSDRSPKSIPLAVEALPPLGSLRSLEMKVGGSRGETPDHVDAAALGRFPELERLVLDSTLELRRPERLRALEHLRVLGLDFHRTVRDLDFVPALPELRHLDITRTAVASLEPLAGHPRLAVVLADSAPIAALPAAPPPGLRLLSVMSTRLADDAVDALSALAPHAEVRHRWNQELADRAGCATRVHVRTGGVCHRRPEHERTLFVSDDPAAVRELLPLLAIDEARSNFHCMCCGTLTIELHQGGELLAEVVLHHGKSLRYRGWPGDGELADPRPLCDWLARHGAPDACGEPGS